MAFDQPAPGAGMNSEAVRAALMEAVYASQVATGKLMAAVGMRTSPAVCLSVLADAAAQIEAQARAVQRASQLLVEGF